MTTPTPSITITPADSTAAHPTPTIYLPATPTPPAPPRFKKPNYNVLHALPLPLTTIPLPPLIPNNPLSLLHIIVAYLFPGPTSHPSPLHLGTFHASTRAIHVTSQDTIKAFWNHGFFGKGSLSRSEPTWVIRRRRALGVIGPDEGLTAEENTERRRMERKEFKRERARVERERREKQLVEEGKMTKETDGNEEEQATSATAKSITFATVEPPSSRRRSLEKSVVDVEDLEHLQLTLEEAFFLAFGLGVLEIKDSETNVCLGEIYIVPFIVLTFAGKNTTKGFAFVIPYLLLFSTTHFRSPAWRPVHVKLCCVPPLPFLGLGCQAWYQVRCRLP